MLKKKYIHNKKIHYIQEYPHKWWVKFFIPNKFLSIQNGGDIFTPTYPQNIGFGLGLRKIIGMNLLVSFSIFPLKTDTGLSSSITDFQIHRYGKKSTHRWILSGLPRFFLRKENKEYILFPDLAVKRWGVEGTYVLHNKRFSMRAAFEQSEKQIKSAGSMLLGEWNFIIIGLFQTALRKKLYPMHSKITKSV